MVLPPEINRTYQFYRTKNYKVNQKLSSSNPPYGKIMTAKAGDRTREPESRSKNKKFVTKPKPLTALGRGFSFEPYFVGDYRPNEFKNDLESFNVDFKLSYYMRWYFHLFFK